MTKTFTSIFAAAVLASGFALASAPAQADEDNLCTHNYYSAKPCLPSVKKWRAWTDLHGLEQNQQSAKVFQHYAEHNHATGDRLLAQLKGTEVDQVAGTGLQVLQLVEGYVHVPAGATPAQVALIEQVRDLY